MKVTIENRDNYSVPVIEGLDIVLSRLVETCHGLPIDEALGKLGMENIDHETLDDILIYCATRSCEQQNATCPGCRLHLKAQSITSIDQYVASHGKISIGDGGAAHMVILGPGERNTHVKSFETLVKTWEGEEYWYWARRVLRKLRHGVRRAHIKGRPFAEDGQNPAVILIQPQLADNIGMCARAMGNFGLDSLRMVKPRDGWPNERSRVAASGANYIIDGATAHESVEDAVCDLNWLCATTARQRDLHKPVMTPTQAIAEMRRRIGQGQKCGILFGPEASGMSTSDLETADALVMIPVNNEFASLNLAQAVLIMGYTWMLNHGEKSLGRVTRNEKPIQSGLDHKDSTPATKAELIGFFEHLEAELDARGFFNPAHRRRTVVQNLRTLFTRAQPTAREVRGLRGIVATLTRAKGGTNKTKE